jgi:bile acid:Na+ symporter, BASS family
MTSATIIRILTICALAGLLGAVGLRLTLEQVVDSLKKCRFTAILLANFIVVPALTAGTAMLFNVDRNTMTAMILLGAAPFAPVVPVFARLARADLALAAGLTCVFPVLSAILTPVVCQVALGALPGTQGINFSFLGVLLTLVATITLPLALGVMIHHQAPALSQRWLRPVEVVSEATGALSLAFVTVTEFSSILSIGWPALIGMVLVFECSVALGYWLGGPLTRSRWVVALGTSNRNIALALLVAIQSFPNTPVVSAVVANGLLLILLGLLHVGYWRLRQWHAPPPA